MTLEVKKIDAAQPVTQTAATDPVKKQELEKEKVNDEIKKALLGDKKAQKERQEELKKVYTEELNLEKKDAKKASQNRVDDEVAEERINNTQVYYDKEDYKEAKKEQKQDYKDLVAQYRKEGKSRREAKKLAKTQFEELEYIKNKKVRTYVENNKDKFFNEDGTFNDDNYKKEIKDWSGDNKLDLSESRAAGKQNQVKAKTIRKAAGYANYDVQKDKTAAKRALHVAETTAIGAAIGAGVGALAAPVLKTKTLVKVNNSFTSTVIDASTGKVVDKIITTKPEEVLVKKGLSAGQGALLGTAIGGIAGLGAGLATMHKIKDQGEKDVFNGISAEEVVKEGAKGIDGIANAKIVNGILKMKNLSDEQKVELFKKHYGENTGKRVTQRELLAAYEEAKKLNGTQTIPPQRNPETCPIDDCPKTPDEENIVTEKEIQAKQYQPKKGEYWAGIISAKYGISGKDLKEAVHELKRQHGITDFTQNVQPKVMNLPEILPVGDKEYALNYDAKVKERTNKFAPAKKYTGKYVNPNTQEITTVYFYTDCNGKRSQSFQSAAERDSAMANDKVKKAA